MSAFAGKPEHSGVLCPDAAPTLSCTLSAWTSCRERVWCSKLKPKPPAHTNVLRGRAPNRWDPPAQLVRCPSLPQHQALPPQPRDQPDFPVRSGAPGGQDELCCGFSPPFKAGKVSPGRKTQIRLSASSQDGITGTGSHRRPLNNQTKCFKQWFSRH